MGFLTHDGLGYWYRKILARFAKITDGTIPVGDTNKLGGQVPSYYAKASDLSAFAKTSDLSIYAKSSDLSNYATTSDLENVSKNTIDLYTEFAAEVSTNYARNTDLANYVPTTGTAAKATADANGNTITTTYKTKAESVNVIISETEPADKTALWVW